MTATLHVWKDRIAFASRTLSVEKTARPAIVIFIGAHSEFTIRTAEGEHRGSAFLIGPNVTRSIATDDARHYSLTLDPTHRVCRYLRNDLLRGRAVLDISSKVDHAVRQFVIAAVDQPQGCAEAYRTSQKILNAIFPETVGTQPVDVRVELVASWLFTHVPKRIDLALLAQLCGLSQGRLTHLFTQEVAISLRQYLLWVKMRRAAELFLLRKPLAEVAHEIGFADSAHLSRTYSRYFGLKPSYLANAKLVQVQFCEPMTR